MFDERLSVVFGEAYQHIVEGESEISVLNDLCAGIADALGLQFMWLERHLSGEIMLPLATSGSGPMDEEIHRLPPHDDDSIVGSAPSVQALRLEDAVLMDITDPGFSPWRKAAEAQGVAAVLAMPLPFNYQGRQQIWAVMFCDADRNRLAAWLAADDMQNLLKRMGRLCEAICLQHQKQLVYSALSAAGNAAFITDTHGTILWANAAFGRLSGYDEQSVLGRNPRILKSGKQGYRYYDRLWRTISSGRVWSGETIDRDSQGELYTIRQTVSPVKTGDDISHYISIHDDISDEKAMREARERARRVDELTGLMTPATFKDRYEHVLQACNDSDQSMALLLLDIHDFQTLMGSLGSDIEELLLETLGDRIRSGLQAEDFAAYLGGGDFSMVLRSVGSIEEARAVGEQILEVLDEPFPLLGDKLYLSRSLGVAFLPQDGRDADELMRIADARAGGTG